jgi:hypothetical protein
VFQERVVLEPQIRVTQVNLVVVACEVAALVELAHQEAQAFHQVSRAAQRQGLSVVLAMPLAVVAALAQRILEMVVRVMDLIRGVAVVVLE